MSCQTDSITTFGTHSTTGFCRRNIGCKVSNARMGELLHTTSGDAKHCADVGLDHLDDVFNPRGQEVMKFFSSTDSSNGCPLNLQCFDSKASVLSPRRLNDTTSRLVDLNNVILFPVPFFSQRRSLSLSLFSFSFSLSRERDLSPPTPTDKRNSLSPKIISAFYQHGHSKRIAHSYQILYTSVYANR